MATNSPTGSSGSSVSSLPRNTLMSKPEGPVMSASPVITGENTVVSSLQTSASTSSSSLSSGVIGGIVVGFLVGGALIGGLVLVFFSRFKRSTTQGARTMEDGQLDSPKSEAMLENTEPAEVASGRLRHPENVDPQVSGNLRES